MKQRGEALIDFHSVDEDPRMIRQPPRRRRLGDAETFIPPAKAVATLSSAAETVPRQVTWRNLWLSIHSDGGEATASDQGFRV